MRKCIYIAIVFIYVVACLAQAEELSMGLVGHWTFDEGSGSKVQDASGNGHVGIIRGDPIWTTGVIGGALSFDGENDSVDVQDFPAVQTYTYSFWVRVYDQRNQEHIGIISQDVGGGNDCHSFYVDKGRLYFRGQSGGYIEADIDLDNWTHIVGTNDEENNQAVLYINGQKFGESAGIACDQAFNNRLVIGEPPYRDVLADLCGQIDDVRVYSRILSPGEVAALYNMGSAGMNTPDTDPPIRVRGYPKTDILPAGVTMVTLSLTTDEMSTCRYSKYPGIPFESMTEVFDTQCGVRHYAKVTGLLEGPHDFYIKCQDMAGNANQDDLHVHFSVAPGSQTFVPSAMGDDYFAAPGIITLPTDTDAGTIENPWDLKTAFAGGNGKVHPGDTVWLAGGTYKGYLYKQEYPSGTEDKPIIYRAMPGQRVTLVATPSESGPSVLRNGGNYIWYWGLELTVAEPVSMWSSAVDERGGTGCKFINMVVHDWPNGDGFTSSGFASEFYGCISYRNGFWLQYAQGFAIGNAPDNVGGSVDDLPWKKCVDCIAFDNGMSGFMNYSTANMANILYQGCISFGNARPRAYMTHPQNFYCGGNKRDDNFVMRDCLTYHAPEPRIEGSVFFAYDGIVPNGRMSIEDSLIIGGKTAGWISDWEQVTFRGNICYSPIYRVLKLVTKIGGSQFDFDDNIYYQDGEHLIKLDETYYDTLEAWQQISGADQNSSHIVGEPTEVWTFLRPNQYEPNRSYLVIYNWPKTESVHVNIAELWPEEGLQYEYKIVNIENIWGSPDAQGLLTDGVIEVPITGAYAPEFACYLVTRTTSQMESSLLPTDEQVSYPVRDEMTRPTRAGHIVEWGHNRGQYDVPDGNDFVAVAGGEGHSVALRSDGSLVAWGDNSLGQCNVPEGNDYIAIDAGWLHSMALKTDGSIVVWGQLDHRMAWQCPTGDGFVAIATGDGYNLALHADGTLWGNSVSYPLWGNDFVAIAAGGPHSLALRADGSIVAVGSNEFGQCDIPDGNDFVDIAAGDGHSLAIRSDGSLVAWGDNRSGQCDVPDGNDFVDIVAGIKHNLALRSDGSMAVWGWDQEGMPTDSGFVAIAAGNLHCLAIRECSDTE